MLSGLCIEVQIFSMHTVGTISSFRMYSPRFNEILEQTTKANNL